MFEKLRHIFNSMASVKPAPLETLDQAVRATAMVGELAGIALGRLAGSLAIPSTTGLTGALLATTALGHGSMQSFCGFMIGAVSGLALQSWTLKTEKIEKEFTVDSPDEGVVYRQKLEMIKRTDLSDLTIKAGMTAGGLAGRWAGVAIGIAGVSVYKGSELAVRGIGKAGLAMLPPPR